MTVPHKKPGPILYPSYDGHIEHVGGVWSDHLTFKPAMWGGGQEEHMIATGKTGINIAA